MFNASEARKLSMEASSSFNEVKGEEVAIEINNKIDSVLDAIGNKIAEAVKMGRFQVSHCFTYDKDTDYLETLITPMVINELNLEGYFVKDITGAPCESEIEVSW